jgi:hypothetical protein
MSFSVDMLRGGAGVVDHRLARRALLNEFKRGRVSRDTVCDAHPELIRAARNLGETTQTRCEVCNDSNVVLLTYVFGHGLPRHGRLITERAEIMKLQRTGHDYAAYVVEVCPACRWHHLLRMLPIVSARRNRAAR